MFSNAAGAIYKSGKTWKVVKIVNKCRPCDLLLKITSACPNSLKRNCRFCQLFIVCSCAVSLINVLEKFQLFQ